MLIVILVVADSHSIAASNVVLVSVNCHVPMIGLAWIVRLMSNIIRNRPVFISRSVVDCALLILSHAHLINFHNSKIYSLLYVHLQSVNVISTSDTPCRVTYIVKSLIIYLSFLFDSYFGQGTF